MHSLNVGEEGSAQEALEMFIEVCTTIALMLLLAISPVVHCCSETPVHRHRVCLAKASRADAVLTMLVGAQVAESHPRFLRRQLPEVVAAMLQFATAENLEEATRQLAAEFLVVLCEAREKAPGMMRKLPTFSQSIFQIMLNFLLDIEVLQPD